MCCMILLTPLTSEERLRIEMVIWDRQKGQTNRKGFGPVKDLSEPSGSSLLFSHVTRPRHCLLQDRGGQLGLGGG